MVRTLTCRYYPQQILHAESVKVNLGTLSTEYLVINAGRQSMPFNKISQILCLSIIAIATSSQVQAAPKFAEFSESKQTIRGVVSQDLEAASAFQRGVTLYGREDLEGSALAFRTALQRDPNLDQAHNYLGNIYLAQNRLEEATQEYGQVIRLNPDFTEAYYNLGVVLQKQNQPQAAITAYRQAIVLDPTLAAAHYNLGLVLYEQRQIPDAIVSYRQAIHFDNHNPDAYFNLAIALQKQGQAEEAIATYRQAVEQDPENAQAYNHLGNLLLAQGQDSQALKVYREAVRRQPDNPTVYYNLGVILYNHGDYKNASSAWNRARKQYTAQGNTQQAQQVGYLIEQIAMRKTNQATQATTTATQIQPTLPPTQSAFPTPGENNQPSTLTNSEPAAVPIPTDNIVTPETPNNTQVNLGQ